MKFFEKIYIVSLKNSTTRRTKIKDSLQKLNLEFEFFDAFDSKNIDINYMKKTKKIAYTGNKFYCTKKCSCSGFGHNLRSTSIANQLSHEKIWKIAYESKKNILILEDDVQLCKNFKEKLLDIKSKLPEDWQYCFIGHCCLNKENFMHVDDGIIQTEHPPLCTHAYMIKKSALSVLIETNSIAWSHIDIQIQKRSLPHLNYYVLDPPLAEQLSITNPGETFKSLTKTELWG